MEEVTGVDKRRNAGEKVVLNVEVKDMDSYIEKAKQFVELLEEAKSLAEDLASVEFKVTIIWC